MSKKVFIAEQETLLEVQEQVEKLVRNLVPDDAPIYGMVIHEASDLNPSTRVEYLGANKDFTPMSMNMSTHAMNYGSWRACSRSKVRRKSPNVCPPSSASCGSLPKRFFSCWSARLWISAAQYRPVPPLCS